MKSIKALSPEVRRAFDKLWDTKDTGLRAIAIASLCVPTLVIGGLDFWESDYWFDFDLAPGSKDQQSSEYARVQKKLSKGREKRSQWMTVFMSYMRVKSDTRFLFYTYSVSFKATIEQSKIPSVSILTDRPGEFYDYMIASD